MFQHKNPQTFCKKRTLEVSFVDNLRSLRLMILDDKLKTISVISFDFGDVFITQYSRMHCQLYKR